MATKLSTFLNSSLLTALDSAGTRAIVQQETINLDSNTAGDYVKTLVGGTGLNVTGVNTHAGTANVVIDSSHVVIRTSAQTLTNKTINLANNTITGTTGQFNAALSGGSFATLTGTEALTNKTLTSPTITGIQSSAAGSITDLTTFSLRDATTSSHELQVIANSASPAMSADRTLTFDVNNANRNISLTGNLTLAGNLVTSGAHNTTLTTSGNTSLTLPTSGTVVSKDGSGNFSAGTITADINRDNHTTVTAGTYGSSSQVPVITVDANGFIDSIGTVSSGGVTAVAFDSDQASVKVTLASGAVFHSRISLEAFDTDDLSEGTKKFFTNAQARGAISVTDAGGDGSLAYNSSTGTITYTGPSAAQVRAHLSASGDVSYNNSTGVISFSETYSTAAELMTAIKTVDGTGTGMDADLLDGQHGSYYRINVYDASGTLLN
jgi:hypothetical protein